MIKLRLDIHGLPFQFVDILDPERDDGGRVETFMPQQRYQNANSTSVHRYGWGPFCEFSISGDWEGETGVYAMHSGDKILYIGETQDLEARFNQGYGSISPRNCFENGQETNCRINSLVRESAIDGNPVILFFYESENRKRTELELLTEIEPLWNKETGTSDQSGRTNQTQGEYQGKYLPLKNHLRSASGTRLELSFSEIEDILGFSLPESAHKYDAWWSNGSQNHSRAWLDVGWKVDDCSFSDQTVRFINK